MSAKKCEPKNQVIICVEFDYYSNFFHGGCIIYKNMARAKNVQDLPNPLQTMFVSTVQWQTHAVCLTPTCSAGWGNTL